MKKATRRFIKMRPNSKYINKIEYRPHPQAKHNHCFENANQEAIRSNTFLVGGWVVGEYNKEFDSTPIMFHFWNMDNDGNHYDVTPIHEYEIKCDYDYVCDDDIYEECYKWAKDNLDNEFWLPPSIKMRNNSVCLAVNETLKGCYDWFPFDEKPITITELLDLRQQVEDMIPLEEA